MTEFSTAWPEVPQEPMWLTIGNFDGLHLGHQALIEALKARARADGALSMLLTFRPHTRVFLQHIQERFYLVDELERLELLTRTGLDKVLTLPFDTDLAEMEAEDFFDLIVSRLNVRGIVLGEGFVMGRKGRGNVELIRQLCEEKHITCLVLPPFFVDGVVVSSRRVRSALAKGQMKVVSRLLGRPYSVMGEVREGKRLGSKLGFPTANQITDPTKMLPRYGVYATLAWINGHRYFAVTSVGVRPTFEDTNLPNVETLLLDFDDNIYHKQLKVDFIAYLRDEARFENLADLIHQIEVDKAEARRILTDGPYA